MSASVTNWLKSWPITFVLLGMTLGVFSFINLLGKPAPLARLNEQIITDLASAASLPTNERIKILVGLKQKQEKALAGKPSEPFAWARLAYLRAATGEDKKAAFEALRFSDFVSPDEPRQLPERALMWRQYRDVETQDQQNYQETLWQHAFRLQPDATWQIALHNNITDEVGEALKHTDAELYEEWKARSTEKR